jgi:hypothetical protein
MYEEEKKIDEEVNKAAQDVGGLMTSMDSIDYIKLAAFQELKDAL